MKLKGGISMQEQEIQYKSNGMELSGTLASPDLPGPFPTVLLITGSGQVDRNENSDKMRLNAFYDISRYLAQNGIASLRYDKRGIGQSQGDYWATGFTDHVLDALAAVQYLKQQAIVQKNQIYVLGHSEGSFLATRMAAEGADVAGIILVAGGSHSGEAVLKWQALQVTKGMKGFNGWLIRTLHIDVSKAQEKQLEKIKKSTQDWYRQQLFVKVNAKWLREFMAYDPALDFPRITVPVLAITGSKDIQVDPADLEQMAQLVNAPFEAHLIQGMTHLLRVEQGEASISLYKEEIKRPIAPELLEIIRGWLKERIEIKREQSA
jgi:pimeloyl-ACP methyl ester carboxylesterase